MSKIKIQNLYKYCSISHSRSRSLYIALFLYIALSLSQVLIVNFPIIFQATKQNSQLKFSIIFPPIRFFCPYSIIPLEDFEHLWFLFLNLKCYVKIDFGVLCIACFQCDCRCFGSSEFSLIGLDDQSCYYFLGNQTKFLTQIFYYSPSDQVFFFFFPISLDFVVLKTYF